MEIKTEADDNDIIDCSHGDRPNTAVFAVSDGIFSAFLCLYIQFVSK